MSIFKMRKVRSGELKQPAEGHASRRKRTKAFLPPYLLYFPSHAYGRQVALGCEQYN